MADYLGIRCRVSVDEKIRPVRIVSNGTWGDLFSSKADTSTYFDHQKAKKTESEPQMQ